MEGRCHSRRGTPHIANHTFQPPQESSRFKLSIKLYKSFCNFIFNAFLFLGFTVTVFAVLQYHCTTCEAKCNMNNLTKNIEEIARNLASIEKNYHELETQITQFSRDLPKIEGHIEILEAIATTMEQSQCRFKIWEPRSQWCLPNVDINLAQGDSTLNRVNSTYANPKPDTSISDVTSAIIV